MVLGRTLCQPEKYKAEGLQLQRFPPNSGDLNPIETVWAWLCRDLAKRELLGEVHSRLEKLVRGMPKRLRQCKKRNYGCCGK